MDFKENIKWISLSKYLIPEMMNMTTYNFLKYKDYINLTKRL